MKRKKPARYQTKYAGVYCIDSKPYGGYWKDRTYNIRYRTGGRLSKQVDEPVGRASEGMTPAKANQIRAMRIQGRELSNKEFRVKMEM